jgi:VCBS repeat-containing protein
LTIAGDKLLFAANDGVHGRGLWRLDYAPTVTDHKYSVSAGNPLIVTGPGLLQDAQDRDNDILTALLVSGPSHGQLALNPDGSFTYTPAPGFEGTDTFTYTAHDPYTFGNLATVNLAVGLAQVAQLVVNK